MRPLRDLATPVSTGTALVVGATGVLMFFHLFEHQVKSMHEWFGIVAVGAAALHVARNWSAFTAYFRRGRAMVAALVLSGLVATGFLASALAGDEGVRPDPRALLRTFEDATVAELSVPLHSDATVLVSRLEQAGFAGAAPDASVRAIASGAGVPPTAVLAALGGGSGAPLE